MNVRALLTVTALALVGAPAWAVAVCLTPLPAGALSVSLTPDPANPSSPQMGDTLRFHTVIRNDAASPQDGLIAWLSLVQVDQGMEQPVDLEDWSAHKAVAATRLAAGGEIATDWPVRLIQAGDYRAVVSVVTRGTPDLTASPFADFTVRRKPVVESERVLPVALGMPLLFGGLLVWRQARGWRVLG